MVDSLPVRVTLSSRGDAVPPTLIGIEPEPETVVDVDAEAVFSRPVALSTRLSTESRESS
ncbi:hypothetical protein DVK05_06060 [Halorubrum sp. Atlit-8R]|uniref:hypothetical protein n=1 Tax=Halorubrum sp. Atlit-9R TaxID=2282127 RepID=UPI000EF20B07|nr:hypothetical protein [Halorubrum sp. Atlit-9R]RLM66799.1 hypothetical protein DVK08_13080 [Halorubrum sp. Atlit-9R]RLM81622.1 hypothetical protein DVK05_06060 [Halorubrum sp. Atlit-8R]